MKSNTRIQNLIATCLLAFSFSQIAFAEGGSKVGDGGFAVYCKSTEMYELLDIYEAKHDRGYTPEWAPSEETVAQALASLTSKARMVLDIDHPFFSVFDRAEFLNATKRLKATIGVETYDSGFLGELGSGCELRQIAVWNSFTTALDVREDFWTQASVRAQALLLTHESLHTWFMYYPKDHFYGTARIRRIVALLSLVDSEFLDRKDEFLRLIQD